MTDLTTLISALNDTAASQDLPARLNTIRAQIDGQLVFTTSFGLEDQMLTHALAKSRAAIDVVTLDTGRLFPETYELWAETEKHYGLTIQPYYPRSDQLEALVREQGINGFFGSLEQRKACCFVRKVEPLNRALAQAAGWVTGLRSQQSQARNTVAFCAFDEGRQILKFNPLYDWPREKLLRHVRSLEVPYNRLHDQGYLSIGCQPCTRAVRIGEEERAGRWWWEQSSQECGLHEALPDADRGAVTPLRDLPKSVNQACL